MNISPFFQTTPFDGRHRQDAPRDVQDLDATIAAVDARMRTAHENHLGYPYNLSFEPAVPCRLGQYLINNLSF